MTGGAALTPAAGDVPALVEREDPVGGFSRTVCFGRCRMGIEGHRFFGKSGWVAHCPSWSRT